MAAKELLLFFLFCGAGFTSAVLEQREQRSQYRKQTVFCSCKDRRGRTGHVLVVTCGDQNDPIYPLCQGKALFSEECGKVNLSSKRHRRDAAIFLHRGNCRATGFNKMVRRIQNGGVPSPQAAAAWGQKRSPGYEPSCYTGRFMSFSLPSNKKVTVPICKTITSYKTACFSSMANNNNQRKCVPSRMITVEGKAFHTACSCAP